ncbi:hypothetical protein F5Y11DRAFT_351521 [Daldinia sp. FL1419]|nr:hypothetical protein F5Y11DRAFT_351521 [Daldinia sp. FL1419]
MSHTPSSSSKETTSHDESITANDSSRTERGSPVPDLPDTSESSDTSADAQTDASSISQDLLGFGAQFDDQK